MGKRAESPVVLTFNLLMVALMIGLFILSMLVLLFWTSANWTADMIRSPDPLPTTTVGTPVPTKILPGGSK